jgi:hypothetical protein
MTQSNVAAAVNAVTVCKSSPLIAGTLDWRWGVGVSILLVLIRLAMFVKAPKTATAQNQIRADAGSIVFSVTAMWGSVAAIAFALGWICEQDVRDRMIFVAVAAVWVIVDSVIKLFEVFGMSPASGAATPPAGLEQ